jgi:hypothetical protein
MAASLHREQYLGDLDSEDDKLGDRVAARRSRALYAEHRVDLIARAAEIGDGEYQHRQISNLPAELIVA